MDQLTPRQLHAWLLDDTRPAPVLLDVRDPLEFDLTHIPGSLSMPLEYLRDTFHTLCVTHPVVVICYAYDLSVEAALFLERRGFVAVSVLLGGIESWMRRIEPSMPRY